MTDAVRLEREKRRAAREEKAWALLTDPTVKRMLMLAGIVGFTAYVTGKEHPGRTETALAIALPTVGIPMIAAEAGITDWKALLALSVASGSVATLASDAAMDAVSIEAPGGYPVLSLLGPIAGLRFVAGKMQAVLRGEQ